MGWVWHLGEKRLCTSKLLHVGKNLGFHSKLLCQAWQAILTSWTLPTFCKKTFDDVVRIFHRISTLKAFQEVVLLFNNSFSKFTHTHFLPNGRNLRRLQRRKRRPLLAFQVLNSVRRSRASASRFALCWVSRLRQGWANKMPLFALHRSRHEHKDAMWSQ